MAKTGSPPRWLELVNERIPQGAKVMRSAGVVPDLTPESFGRLAGRCPVFRVEAAGVHRTGPAGA